MKSLSELGIETDRDRYLRLKEEENQRLKQIQQEQQLQDHYSFIDVHEKHGLNMANQLLFKFSNQSSNSDQSTMTVGTDYNQNVIVGESQLTQLNHLHELDSLLFPKYVTTSQMNSIKTLANPAQFLGTSLFTVEDGIEELDVSEFIEIAPPTIKRKNEEITKTEKKFKR